MTSSRISFVMPVGAAHHGSRQLHLRESYLRCLGGRCSNSHSTAATSRVGKKRKARDQSVYLMATICMIHQPDCSSALALKLPVEVTASSSTMSDSGVVTIREVKPAPDPVVVV